MPSPSPSPSLLLVDLPLELAQLFGRSDLPKVRRTPDGRYSLADIGAVMTGADANHASRDVLEVTRRFPEVTQHLGDYNFPGRGRRTATKLGTLATVLEYIMLMPGKMAARVRVEAARILVRYLGGDLAMIDEIKKLRCVQEHLAEVDPANWRRAFGEAVEADAAAKDDAGDSDRRRKRQRLGDEILESQAAKARAEAAKTLAEATKARAEADPALVVAETALIVKEGVIARSRRSRRRPPWRSRGRHSQKPTQRSRRRSKGSRRQTSSGSSGTTGRGSTQTRPTRRLCRSRTPTASR